MFSCVYICMLYKMDMNSQILTTLIKNSTKKYDYSKMDEIREFFLLTGSNSFCSLLSHHGQEPFSCPYVRWRVRRYGDSVFRIDNSWLQTCVNEQPIPPNYCPRQKGRFGLPYFELSSRQQPQKAGMKSETSALSKSPDMYIHIFTNIINIEFIFE